MYACMYVCMRACMHVCNSWTSLPIMSQNTGHKWMLWQFSIMFNWPTFPQLQLRSRAPEVFQRSTTRACFCEIFSRSDALPNTEVIFHTDSYAHEMQNWKKACIKLSTLFWNKLPVNKIFYTSVVYHSRNEYTMTVKLKRH